MKTSHKILIAVSLTVALAAVSLSLAQTMESKSSVTYFEKSKVDASFAKAAVLTDHGNYKVITGHRDKAGEAEFHEKDTDVIYVVQGTATFITGGEVVDGKTTAPDEIRGPSIKGGETHKLSQGDVIIVPSSTPHQFTEVTDPFLYFVVKVR